MSPERYIELMGKFPELIVFTIGIGIVLLCGLFMFGLFIYSVVEWWRER